MREHFVRGVFSSIAGAVFLATSAEWFGRAVEKGQPWRFIPAYILACFAVFEAAQVWHRVDKGIRLL